MNACNLANTRDWEQQADGMSGKRSFFDTAPVGTSRWCRMLMFGLIKSFRKSMSRKVLKARLSLRYDNNMLVGYARVSTLEQDVSLQVDALKQAGCGKIFRDKASGAKSERPGLRDALEYAREGDTLLVWSLDRLGRSLKHLIETVTLLEGRGVGFRSLQEAVDTTTSGGRLIFHVFGALAEFERSLIRERTRAGLAAARARGRKGGRPKALDSKKIRLAYELYDEKKYTIREICQILGISKPTLYVYLRQRTKRVNSPPRSTEQS